MVLQERIDLLVQLGAYLRSEDDFLQAIFHRVAFNNAWLTKENNLRAAKAVGEYLQPDMLNKWAGYYQIQDPLIPKKIGLVPAGNTPLLGLLDLVTIFLSGQYALVKGTESDEYTLPHLAKMLEKWSPNSKPYFQITPAFLKGFDAVIVTKTKQQNRYFEAYFGKYPNLLRTNKNSVAVLTGTESDAQLLALGDDVFAFYGLSPNNVSKLYLPKGYDLEHLLELFHEYREIVLNNRYKNNFDYNYALFLLNKMDFKANGCILLTEQTDIPSRIACLHYEYYDKEADVVELLKQQKESIQFVVSEKHIDTINTIKMGQCHRPNWLHDSQQETMRFLQSL